MTTPVDKPYGVDALIAMWRRREETYARAGLPGMASTARRYREALERFRVLERHP